MTHKPIIEGGMSRPSAGTIPIEQIEVKFDIMAAAIRDAYWALDLDADVMKIEIVEEGYQETQTPERIAAGAEAA